MTERTVKEILEAVKCGFAIEYAVRVLDSLYAKKHCKIACDAVEHCVWNEGLGKTICEEIKQALGVSDETKR